MTNSDSALIGWLVGCLLLLLVGCGGSGDPNLTGSDDASTLATPNQVDTSTPITPTPIGEDTQVTPPADVTQPPLPEVVTPAPDSQTPTTAERINIGFIGGPCGSDADCKYEGGSCLKESEGFPGGYCSKVCDKFCPDPTDANASGTLCIEAKDLGLQNSTDALCAQKCNFFAFPEGGCATGYHCEVFPRPDLSTFRGVCVAGSTPQYQPSECMQELIQRGVYFEVGYNQKEKEPVTGVTCDVKDPVWFGPNFSGVTLRTGGLTAKTMYGRCDLALAIAKTAEYLKKESVTDIIQWGTYNCRVISGTTSVSQHGHGNAVDIAGVVVRDDSRSCEKKEDCGEDGTCGEDGKCRVTWTVLADWEMGDPTPETDAGIMLYDFAKHLYNNYIFNIILTPEYNDDHRDHFHVDLTPNAHSLPKVK